MWLWLPNWDSKQDIPQCVYHKQVKSGLWKGQTYGALWLAAACPIKLADVEIAVTPMQCKLFNYSMIVKFGLPYCAGCLKIWQEAPRIYFDNVQALGAKEGFLEDAGDHIVATGEVTINDGPPADKATSHRLLDVSFIHAHRQALIRTT